MLLPTLHLHLLQRHQPRLLPQRQHQHQHQHQSQRQHPLASSTRLNKLII